MRIKYFIVLILVIILCFSIYLLVSFKSKNDNLRLQYDALESVLRQNEIDKEEYNSKTLELEGLKEAKKDKVIKYEEVEKWNQEIKKYLD